MMECLWSRRRFLRVAGGAAGMLAAGGIGRIRDGFLSLPQANAAQKFFGWKALDVPHIQKALGAGLGVASPGQIRTVEA